MTISYEIYKAYKDQPILHDEDEWCGKYRTYGEMWQGEGYIIDKEKGETEMKYTVRDRETWNWIIAEFDTIEEARAEIERQEKEDVLLDQFEPNCYDIVDEETKSSVIY